MVRKITELIALVIDTRTHLSPGRIVAVSLTSIFSVLFTLTMFVIALELSEIAMPAHARPLLDELNQQYLLAQSLQSKFALKAEYYLVIASVMWKSWAALTFGVLVTIFLVSFLTRSAATDNMALRRLKYERDQAMRARELARRKLESFDNRLLEAYEQSNQAFILLDSDLTIRKFNDRAHQVLSGWADESRVIEGGRLVDLMPAFDQTALPTVLDECLTLERPWQGEVQFEEDTWLNVRVFPANSGVFVALRDISHRKKSVSLMEVSESLLRQMVTTAPFPMAVVNNKWQYMMVSQRWREQFQLGEGELRGVAHTAVLPDFPGNWNRLNTLLREGRVVKSDEERFRLYGNEEWITWQVRPWFDVHSQVGGYIVFAEIVTEQVQARQRAKEARKTEHHLAYHDTLTGLPNRQLFSDRLNMALAHSYRQLGQVALMFLDLDGFKPINDTHGHDAGDILLKVIAKRLQECVRQTDTVARMGGDEFTVVLNGPKSHKDVEAVAEKIIQVINQPVDIGGGVEVQVTTSIGVSMYPEDGSAAGELIKKADAAMYTAKKSGKNQARFFEEGMVNTREAVA